MPAARLPRRDRLVCKCLLVSEGQIQDAIAGGARSVAAIGGACEAGTGCTGCHRALEVLLHDAETRRERAAARRAARRPQLGLFGGASPADGESSEG